jgi:hypothetical protein
MKRTQIHEALPMLFAETMKSRPIPATPAHPIQQFIATAD